MLRGTVKWFNNKKVMVLLIPTAKKKTCLFILRHWKSPDCAVCPKVRGSILTFMTTAAARLPATLPFELTVRMGKTNPALSGVLFIFPFFVGLPAAVFGIKLQRLLISGEEAGAFFQSLCGLVVIADLRMNAV